MRGLSSPSCTSGTRVERSEATNAFGLRGRPEPATHEVSHCGRTTLAATEIVKYETNSHAERSRWSQLSTPENLSRSAAHRVVIPE
jgi:hypothetical protein